ncbi:MAG: heavy metal-binding domain-containing protein, partial [Fidelibacterota bacterium]
MMNANKTLQDPVCGMTVTEESAVDTREWKGTVYGFCSQHCLESFDKEPGLYVRDEGGKSKAVAGAETPPVQGADYTCPMHPEVVQEGPGSCPICGMALEPRTVTLGEEKNPELVDMTRRFWISLVLTVPLLAIVMSERVWGRSLVSG